MCTDTLFPPATIMLRYRRIHPNVIDRLCPDPIGSLHYFQAF